MSVKDALRALEQAWRMPDGPVLGLYAFGSVVRGGYRPGLSDVNLLALLAEETPPRPLREAHLPVWEQFGPVLRRPPLLTGPAAWERLGRVNPVLHAAISRHARPIWGPALPAGPAPTGPQAAAWQAWRAWQASAALAAPVLQPDRAADVELGLRRLALGYGVDPEDPSPGALVAATQAQLQAAISGADAKPQPQANAPPLLPELVAIYSLGDDYVFILPDGRPAVWAETDWAAVGESLAGECDAVFSTTVAQGRFIAGELLPIDLALGSLSHVWGTPVLDDVPVSDGALWRASSWAAASPALDALPAAYLTAPEGTLGKVIHDFQNRLLNLQLRQEILFRMGRAPDAEPDEPLPDRKTEPHRRVAAIFDHFHWWAGHYAGLMTGA